MQTYGVALKREGIEKIFISENDIICIKPQELSFKMIYRSAVGVYWNDEENYLYHNQAQNWSFFQSFEHIVKAVKIEYGVQLKIMPNTIYENLDDCTILTIKKTFSYSRVCP